MIAVDGPQQESQLHDLMAYLIRPKRPKFQVVLRPYCPTHDMRMVGRKSLSGTTTYYCPCVGCRESWKGRKRVV